MVCNTVYLKPWTTLLSHYNHASRWAIQNDTQEHAGRNKLQSRLVGIHETQRNDWWHLRCELDHETIYSWKLDNRYPVRLFGDGGRVSYRVSTVDSLVLHLAGCICRRFVSRIGACDCIFGSIGERGGPLCCCTDWWLDALLARKARNINKKFAQHTSRIGSDQVHTRTAQFHVLHSEWHVKIPCAGWPVPSGKTGRPQIGDSKLFKRNVHVLIQKDLHTWICTCKAPANIVQV
jgi:hypothetical protein